MSESVMQTRSRVRRVSWEKVCFRRPMFRNMSICGVSEESRVNWRGAMVS